MSMVMLDGVAALAGKVESLIPLLLISGGAVSERAVYPGLTIDGRLAPQASKSILWAHAGLASERQSFEAARSLIGCNWDAEMARLELANTTLIDIETGDPDWDAALAQAQHVGLRCYVGPTRHLPSPSIVHARLPNHGFSARGNGKDYGPGWDGQPANLAYLSAKQVMPFAPDLAEGLLRNFLAAQMPDGTVDWKPGLGGQRNGCLSMPLLATLAWLIYERTGDVGMIETAFPKLQEFFEMWFTKPNDRDQDGHPEWANTIQAGFDDWPSFVRWQEKGQGMDITKAETPDLASYLYRECQALLAMARELDEAEEVAQLEARGERLKAAVEACWNEGTSAYQLLDRELHACVEGMKLGEGKGSFSIDVGQFFNPQVRVQVRCIGPETLPHPVKVFIHGRGSRGRHRVERIGNQDFQWFWKHGTVTSEKTYAEIERIEVQGLSDDFETEISVADFTRQDVTGLLPLWAGIPSQERAQRLVYETLHDPERFWRMFGVPNCSAQDAGFLQSEGAEMGGVSMYWNTLIVEGLMRYGFVDEAADLVSRLMQAMIASLRQDGAFRQRYHPDHPRGYGERDHLLGVLPIGLFLEVLGIQFLSDSKVRVCSRNPFPWPITVRWRGLEIVHDATHTLVTFVDGQQAEVGDEGVFEIEQIR